MTGQNLPPELIGANSSDAAFPNGLRGVRYGEILLLRATDAGFQAQVWNTLGLNDCPDGPWEALDAEAIAAEHGALIARMNGPRYWTLDAIISKIRESAALQRFGELDMFEAAVLELGNELPSQEPYTHRSVRRETVFQWKAGSEIYELTDPEGLSYVMQSYALIVDPELTMDQLSDLGDRLTLPDGWAYGRRVLDADLNVLSTDGVATVIQDELQNTYQLANRVAQP